MPRQQKTLGELAAYSNADLRGDPACVITGVGTLQSAKEGELSFLTNPLYRHFLSKTKASAVILSVEDARNCPTNALVTDNPHFVYAKLAAIFDSKPRPKPGIHATAVIGENCHIDDSVTIGARAVIGNNTVISANTIIGPGVVIGQDCKIGDDCVIEANVTIEFATQIHNRVIIHGGAVLGSDGFGMAEKAGVWHRVPQLGRVVIEDDVEIGANTTIDRGALDDTVIERGVKLDNQIQIAHNVRIGAHTVIAGCTGIAGSAKVGKHCKIGGAVTIAGHVDVADYTMLTGTATVSNSIKEPGVYSSGVSCMPHGEWLRNIGRLRQLDKIIKKWTWENKHLEKGEHDVEEDHQPRRPFKAERVEVVTDQYMTINEMIKCLPQRAPFLLIDRVVEFMPEGCCCQIMYSDKPINENVIRKIQSKEKIVIQTSDGKTYFLCGVDENKKYFRKKITENEHIKKITSLFTEKTCEPGDTVTIKDAKQRKMVLDIAISYGSSALTGECCLKAIKNVTMNESFFQGHFPEQPIMPGVLILEALGQAGTVLANLVMQKKDKPNTCYLAGIDNARFRKPVEPGDQLLLSVKCTHARRGALKMQGVAMVGNEIVCTADILSVSKSEEDKSYGTNSPKRDY